MEPMSAYRRRFTDAVADDLGTPRGLAIAHEAAADPSMTDAQRRALLLDFDRVLGVSLNLPAEPEAPLPEGAAELLERRAAARDARDFAASDALREELAAIGVEVRDTTDGQEARVAGRLDGRAPIRPGRRSP
jgi:cysteinyl-tRNA synthetase